MPIRWSTPWYEADDPSLAQSFCAELACELPPGHVLLGISPLQALGYRQDQDDVAFSLPDGRVALVHLSWEHRPATPPLPTTELLDSLAAFQQVLDHVHREWTSPKSP